MTQVNYTPELGWHASELSCAALNNCMEKFGYDDFKRKPKFTLTHMTNELERLLMDFNPPKLSDAEWSWVCDSARNQLARRYNQI